MLLRQDIPKNARRAEKRFRNFKYSGKKITKVKLENIVYNLCKGAMISHMLPKWLCYNLLKVVQNSFQNLVRF